MDPTSEIPEGEKTVVTPELGAKMAEATQRIETQMAEPGADIAAATGQMSMMAELWKLGKETGVKRLGVLFKDAKAILGIVPFAPMIGKALGSVSKTETLVSRVGAVGEAEKKLMKTEKGLDKTKKKLAGARDAANKADASKLQDRQIALDSAATASMKARQEHTKTQRRLRVDAASVSADLRIHANALSEETLREKAARLGRKAISVPATEQDMIRRYKINMDQLSKKSPGKAVSDIDMVRWAGNGDMPALTKGEAFGRRAKFVGKHLLLEQLGPIINPVPDVPGVVTLASYGSELLGFVWGGLIPPLWQYVHNRYENAKLMVESTQKASEIVKRHWNQKFDKAKEPQVAKAAEAFLPTPATASV